MIRSGDASALQLESRRLFLQGLRCGREDAFQKRSERAVAPERLQDACSLQLESRRLLLPMFFASMRWRRTAPYVVPAALTAPRPDPADARCGSTAASAAR